MFGAAQGNRGRAMTTPRTYTCRRCGVTTTEWGPHWVWTRRGPLCSADCGKASTTDEIMATLGRIKVVETFEENGATVVTAERKKLESFCRAYGIPRSWMYLTSGQWRVTLFGKRANV
jgi:hypothetical protein